MLNLDTINARTNISTHSHQIKVASVTETILPLVLSSHGRKPR